MSTHNVNLGQLKEIAPSLRKDTEQNQFRYAPMFLPVDATEKKGTGVVKVVTRQSFLDENIDTWVKWNMYKGVSAGLGIAALALLGTNIVLSGAAALAAGYYYGQVKRKEFIVTNLLKKRWLLEGT
jgi:hypothetical protein